MPNQFHFSIRDLLALAAIVALSLTLLSARAEKVKLETKLNVLLSRPKICELLLYEVNPPDKYHITANISLTGMLFPNDYSSSKGLTVWARMFHITTGQVIGECRNALNPNGGLGFTINHESELEPGFYPILVEVLDGSIRVAHASTTVQLVDGQKGIKD